MKCPIRISGTNGTEIKIKPIDRDDWDGVDEPCPECGGGEFNQFTTSGNHVGQQGTAVIIRSDFWDATRQLFVRCRGCNEVLFKHPAFELLYQDGEFEDALVDL